MLNACAAQSHGSRVVEQVIGTAVAIDGNPHSGVLNEIAETLPGTSWQTAERAEAPTRANQTFETTGSPRRTWTVQVADGAVPLRLISGLQGCTMMAMPSALSEISSVDAATLVS